MSIPVSRGRREKERKKRGKRERKKKGGGREGLEPHGGVGGWIYTPCLVGFIWGGYDPGAVPGL